MRIKHSIRHSLLKKQVYVDVVGAGGTGSALLPRLMQLHHALLALGHPRGLHVRVYDNDIVSNANIGRQGFFPSDVGQYKAMVLVNRLNMAWGTSWTGIPLRINRSDRMGANIVIGCVDTRKARSAIISAYSNNHCYYLDCGNSVSTGQVVLGEIGNSYVMKAADRLPTVADFFPESVNPDLDKEDDAPSCSVADALRKQSLVINMAMATAAFNLLWMLFREPEITYSAQMINLKSGVASPIRMDTAVWERIGYIAPVKPKRTRKKVMVTNDVIPALLAA